MTDCSRDPSIVRTRTPYIYLVDAVKDVAEHEFVFSFEANVSFFCGCENAPDTHQFFEWVVELVAEDTLQLLEAISHPISDRCMHGSIDGRKCVLTSFHKNT